MMERKSLHCIMCPRGCELAVIMKEGEICEISGNACPNGERYAKQELTAPKRILTGTVRLIGAGLPLLPVVSNGELPKHTILTAAAELRKVEVTAPVKMGQVIIHNILGTGTDIVSSCDFACIKH